MLVYIWYSDGRYTYTPVEGELNKNMAYADVPESTVWLWRQIAVLDEVMQQQLLNFDNKCMTEREGDDDG